MKKLLSVLIVALVLAGISVPALASASSTAYRGFTRWGAFSDSRVSFGFEPDETVTVYNGEAQDENDFYRVITGSTVYIPIHRMTPGSSTASPTVASQSTLATDRDIRDNQIELAWIPKQGERYINSVTMIDGRRERVDGLTAGTYAKIDLNNSYSGQGTAVIELDLVLSVRRLSHPETQISLRMSMVNREVTINRSTVYTAQTPTQFNVARNFTASNVTFDFGSGVQYTVRVQPQDRYFLHLDRSQDRHIADMYPDSYLEYYNFLGDRDTFSRNGELNIPINRSRFIPSGADRPQVYVYQVDRGNTLRALGERDLTFDSRRDILTITTNSLGYYVLSDIPLHRIIDDEEEDVIYVGYAVNEIQSGGSTSGLVNNNPITGPVGPIINADNPRSDNPLTSDTTKRVPVSLWLMVAGLTAAGVWRKGMFGKGKVGASKK